MNNQTFITEALKVKDYEYLLNHFQDLLNADIKIYNLDNIKTNLDNFIIFLFELDKFNYIDKLYIHLQENGIESYTILTYELIITFVNDIYKALSIINNSKLFNETINNYYEDGGANYINLLKENKEIKLAYIFIDFIKHMAMINICNSCDNNIVVKYYELISFLYEIGYEEEIIDRLNEIGYKIFKGEQLK